MLPDPFLYLLERALDARSDLIASSPQSAIRLFNGFLEGCPDLVIELYDDTLVVLNHANPPEGLAAEIETAASFYQQRLAQLACILVKNRRAGNPQMRRGVVVRGSSPTEKIQEHGVWYALDLTLNQDTSFYLDTRSLRLWAIQNLAGKTTLNTFAYTGSLGVAAMAGGARRVIQLDRSREFLGIGQRSYALNRFPFRREDFRVQDFFGGISAFKQAGESFECVFLDPPLFSTSSKGTVNLVSESTRLINKVRPVVTDSGWLVAVNNALFVSGSNYLHTLESLCADGYLAIEALIPIPEDCTGYPQTRVRSLPADPTPFNHSTKIALLRAKSKA